MGLVDFILNAAALLLWLNWRAAENKVSLGPPGMSLLSTLRRPEPSRYRRWLFLAALVALLGLRALFYWQIGAVADWTPRLNLGALVLHFRSDYAGRMLLFSLLSFGLVLAIFYLSLLLLSVVNMSVSERDPWQRLVRQQLGRVDRWPIALKLLLPVLVAALLWLALSAVLGRSGLLPPPKSASHVAQQAAVIGLAAYLAWKYLIVGVLLVHLLNSYVYLGNHSLWTFVNTTARQLVAPLRRLPLQLGKVDFSPLVGIVVVLLVAESVAGGLTALYQRLPL